MQAFKKIKSSYLKFLKQVHPDYHRNDMQKFETNQKSLQILNEIMDTVELGKPFQEKQLAFYVENQLIESRICKSDDLLCMFEGRKIIESNLQPEEEFNNFYKQFDHLKDRFSILSRKQITGRLTFEERSKRIKNNLCMYCGEKDHVLAECRTRTDKKARSPWGGKFNRGW